MCKDGFLIDVDVIKYAIKFLEVYFTFTECATKFRYLKKAVQLQLASSLERVSL